MALLPFSTEAIVLRTVPCGESDLVVHLLGRGLGKVGAFARGARKSVKRFGGGIEPFVLLDAELLERRGAELFELRAVHVLEPYRALRADLGRLAHAGYATELGRELLRDREPHDPLLDALLGFFAALERAGPRSLTLRAFELEALGAAGLAPRLTQCARCDSPIVPDDFSGFEPGLGGVLCGRCVGPGALPLDPAAHRLLVVLQQGGVEAAEEATEEGLPLESIRRVLGAFINRHVRHDLRSRAFLEDVGAPL